MRVYYNEIDHGAAGWLRELITRGLIPAGTVDERSIVDVRADDLAGFDQCHFFAGIGGWPYALRLAGWRGPVWTGSCPCQPFSSAGKRQGVEDKRHLWPEFRRLIAECNPPTIFGEQVASKDGRLWLSGVRSDMEALGYAVGAADLCAAGVGAPHIRQRLFWVANSQHAKRGTDIGPWEDEQHGGPEGRPEAYGGPGARGEVRGMGNPSEQGLAQQRGNTGVPREEGRTEQGQAPLGTGAWSNAEWLPCLDGKARRIEPSTFPLAHGVPSRVGRLRGYGNAIVPQVAAEFVTAFMECRE